ncbi:hypothetical protein BDR22DRAFT_965431 [Usnea florida]
MKLTIGESKLSNHKSLRYLQAWHQIRRAWGFILAYFRPASSKLYDLVLHSNLVPIVGQFCAPMEQSQASYSYSNVFGMANSRSGPRSDGKICAPFQSIIDKGKQAKAQDEHEQYEARKAKKETDIKNAARIRHAEAEANRRRAAESKFSLDDHKGKLLDHMTINVKAILENQYREEIREKVYEEEEKIISAYEHDMKDQTKARLVRELEPVVKAKLEAEFEPEVKQQLTVELESVVKAELRVMYQAEIKQQLAKELRPEVEAGLREKHAMEVKQQLAQELEPGIKAELHAKYKDEIRDQVRSELEPSIIQKQEGTHLNDIENQSPKQPDALSIPDNGSFKVTPNGCDSKGDEYPDLSHHQHLINQTGVEDSQQVAGSGQVSPDSDTDAHAVNMPLGTKRSLSDRSDEEEDPYARHSKRSRSASFNSQEQYSPNGGEAGVTNPYSNYLRIEHPNQGVLYNDEELHYMGNVGYEDTQVFGEYRMKREVVGYNSSDEVEGSHGIMLGHGVADLNSAEGVQGVNGNHFDDHQAAVYDNHETGGGMRDEFLDRQRSIHQSDVNMRETNGNSLDNEEAEYDSAEDLKGSNGYKLDAEVTESYSSEGEEVDEEEGEDEDDEDDEDEDEDEDDEEYESEEEELHSNVSQTAPHSTSRNGVITFANTQDTAFVLSDSEEHDEDNEGDEDKTLVGYEGSAALNDLKQYNVPGEESLFLDN